MIPILEERQPQIQVVGQDRPPLACEKHSLAGSVSQRACVFCGSRVVLYPIADALHLVHGPIGCAVYTWDIRGALSSGPQLHRLSFSTDLLEKDVIFGGEKKLQRALLELIEAHRPKAAFVYSTCIVGLIGDDVAAVCKRVAAQTGIPVLPVHSEGFKGTKKDGYRAACEALATLIGTSPDRVGGVRTSAQLGDGTNTDALLTRGASCNGEGGFPQKPRLNILGDFNIAGETWIVRKYYERMGLEVVATITGDGRVDDIRRAHTAQLNVVQCSGSMTSLAQIMQERYGIPFLRVSYFGLEDNAKALYDVAGFFGDAALQKRTQDLVRQEVETLVPELERYRSLLEGKRAALYTGGAFKALSLVRALRLLGMKTVLAGSQTGNAQDYQQLREICDPGTVLVDDTNPLELARYVQEQRVDLLIGGVKERPIAYKLGVAFCDHNHERKVPLAGFEGMLHFAREVHASVNSPIWELVPRKRDPETGLACKEGAA